MNTGSPVNKFRGKHRPSKSSSAVGALGFPLSQQVASHNYIAHNVHQPSRHVAQSHAAPRRYEPPTTTNGTVTPPQTPPKTYQHDVNGMPMSAKKKRSKSKPKPKELTAGDVVQQENTTDSCFDDLFTGPPSPSRGLTTPTKPYAGPNFHSSPAPSSLPVPSFFSKSVPPTPVNDSFHSLMLQDDLSSGSLTGSSSPEVSEAESHLDKLFRADKEEKARVHRRDIEAESTLSEPAPASIIDEQSTGPRSRLDESPKRDSFETSVFTMDLDTKGSILSRYERTPPIVAQDWKSKSMALKSFLDGVQPTNLDSSLPVVPPPNSLQAAASQQYFQHRKSTPMSNVIPNKKQTSSPPSQYQNSRSPARQPHNPRFMPTHPRGPTKSKYHNPTADETPTPPRRYCNPLFASSDADFIHKEKNANSQDVKEMEDYLRRVLKLDLNTLTALAATS